MDNVRDLIVCIIGKSGSGKSTIVDYFSEKGYNVIQSYTDRPKRTENEWGHIFIDTDMVEEYRNEMIAHAIYNGYHYFATKSQYKSKGVSFYIIEPSGVESLKQELKDADLLFIYVHADESTIKKRMERRFSLHNELNFNLSEKIKKQIDERIYYDRKAFSRVKCNFVVDNNGELQNTVDIIEDILSEFN